MLILAIQNLSTEVSKGIDRLSAFYSQHILSYVARSKATYIVAIVVTLVSYQFYRFSYIPRKLRHIPAVPFWSYMLSVISGTTPELRRGMIYSVLSKSPSGVYLKPSRRGWSVGIIGPQAMRAVFLRKGMFAASKHTVPFPTLDSSLLISKMTSQSRVHL